ncbi:MAG: YitT family protein [Acholeplasmataceae bacterium]
MKKIKFFKSEKFKNFTHSEPFRILIIIVSTAIYGIGLGWFLEASAELRIYGGGIPGIAQLIVDIVKLSNGGQISQSTRDIIMFVTILGLNIPLFLLGWFGVSKRFTMYSMISVTIQATIIGYLKVDIFKDVEPALLAIIALWVNYIPAVTMLFIVL